MHSRLGKGWFAGFALVLGLGLLGCEVDSSENATRNVSIDVTGFYVGSGGGAMVSRTSGAQVLNMNVRQNGDQLEVVDNNGIVFRGSIGQVIDTSASFTLQGRATSGQDVTISGNFNVNGSSADMSGSWIEPTLVSTLFGSGAVPGVVDEGTGDGTGGDAGDGDGTDNGTGTDDGTGNDNDNGTGGGATGTLAANPNVLTTGETSTLTATGGSGDLVIEISGFQSDAGTMNTPDDGSISATTQNNGQFTATYTAGEAGTVTIIVTEISSATQLASVTIDVN